MSYCRRIRSGLCATLEQVIGQIENHDALVESALREVRAATRRSGAHLARVRRNGADLRARYDAMLQDQKAWKQRAMRVAEHEERALECLRRSRKAEQEATSLREQMAQHDEVEAQLAQDVQALEKKLAALQHKHQQMRTRQACADATLATEQVGGGLAEEIGVAFERWELQLAESEVIVGRATEDPLRKAFEQEEELASLRAELAAMQQEPRS